MRSRVPCCNGGLVRRDLVRTALLWAAYLILWFVAMPGNIYSGSEWMTEMDIREVVLDLAAGSCHGVSFLYGLVVAWYLFSYLHKSRSVNFFGALPLRRETQFLSHYISGILCSFLPNLVLVGITLLAGGSCGVNLALECAIWFAAQSLTFVFYFSFAVLCAMLVGNLIAMPLLYLVLNFTAVVVEILVKELLQALLYGFWFNGEMTPHWLSPMVYAMEDGGPGVTTVWQNEVVVDLIFKGWQGLLVLGAVGVAIAVVAFLIHRSRRMESAGDVMAIRHLRPVFLYAFTFGCTIVIGTLLANMLVDSMDSSRFWNISACLLVSTVAGHYLGHMMLQRSLRVFHRKNAISCGVCILLMLVVLGGLRFDVLGIENYIPEFEDVDAVRFSGRHNVDAPQRIEDVLELHVEILEQKEQTEAMSRRGVWDPQIELTYVLKNGREVTRAYRLPVDENTAKDPESLIRIYEDINNTPEMILSRQMPEVEITRQTVENCFVWYELPNEGAKRLEPTAAEAAELWQTAILADIMAGNMGKTYYTDSIRSASEQTVAVSVATYSGVSVEFELRWGDDKRNYYHYSIPKTAVHTKAALAAMGVPAESFTLNTAKG